MDWLDKAKELALGRRTRIVCCQGDRSAIVSHDAKGYSLYCFRCDRKEYKGHGERSISAVLAARHAASAYASASYKGAAVAMPADAVVVSEGPAVARVWLANGGVSPGRATELGIRYSYSLNRVVLPIYSRSGALIGVQARAVDPRDKPKYLNLSNVPFESVVFWCGLQHLPGTVTITEDMLSAIAVAKVAPAASVLGVKAGISKVQELLAVSRSFNVWLDPDEPGRAGARKIKHALELQGATVRLIASEQDPKCYSADKIREYLYGTN